MSQEEVMSPDTAMDAPDWFGGRFARKMNVRLAGAAGGLLLALLLAPQSRRLFLAQVGMTVPIPATIASYAGSQIGIHPDPFYGQIATPAAHAAARRHPDDLQMQIADACTVSPQEDEPNGLPSKAGKSVDDFRWALKVRRMRALESRFGERPALYANILRYEAMDSIHPQHQAEQCAIDGAPIPLEADRKTPAAAEVAAEAAHYTAYDRDAAQGERLDPDNAYFPFMRAIGLFGQHRDGDALAAMTRAAHKPLWREYYNDELKGQWKLQDAASVNNSALLHTVSAAALLFPQYAQMRGAARVMVCKAMQAEQAGHIRAGLALREDVARLGILMRAQSSSLIGATVGDALTDVAVQRPGGLPALRDNQNLQQKNRMTRRGQFDDYLGRVGAKDAAPTFHAAQRGSDEMHDIIREGEENLPFEASLRTLSFWWVADILALSNILWLLVAGGMAALTARGARIKAGQPAPVLTRSASTLGLAGGALAAPFLLLSLSPLFENLSGDARFFMLLAGCAPAPTVLLLTSHTPSERMRRLTAFAYGLPIGAALTGFCVWQGRGLARLVTLSEVFFNLSSGGDAGGPALRANILWLTPCVLGLALLGIVTMSRACHVPLSVGLARGLRGLMVPVCAILFLIYGVLLLFTIRAERSVQYGLDRALENEGQVIADLSGKQWPRSDVTKK